MSNKKRKLKKQSKDYYQYNKVIAYLLLLFLIVLSFQSERLFTTIPPRITGYQTINPESTSSIYFPYFRIRRLDARVNEIIAKLDNEYIRHETFFIENEFVNIFFTVGAEHPSYYNFLLSIKTGKIQNINSLFISGREAVFYEIVNYTLNEKYPPFITNVINNATDNESGHLAFQIKEHKIRVYFSDFQLAVDHPIYVDINYNVIKDILLFDFLLDENIYNTQNAPRQNVKYIILTFDDGPLRGTTDEIIRLLEHYGMSATFFMIGQQMLSHPDLVLEAMARGNDIGNHTFSHPNLRRVSRQRVNEEITRPNEIFYHISSQRLNMFRAPFGILPSHVIYNYPFSFFNWSIDPRDWENRDARYIANHILDRATAGDIILLHDIYLTTTEAVRILLPELYSRGFQAVSLSEFAQIKNINFENHVVYRQFHQLFNR